MTLTDTAMQIAGGLLGAALAVAFIVALHGLRRRRYQGPFSEPYAGFQTGAHAEAGEQMWLECEGHCDGTTTHESNGDESATCVLCGTARSALPDFAAIDDEA